jgi:heptosyltransferase I
MKLPFTSTPKNICILRLSAVGDVCHTLAVVRSIQLQWPETKLTWIIGKLEASLVGDIPDIEFIIFDKSKGLQAYRQLHRQLKNQHFDALLHMQISIRSSIASRFVRTPIRIGFDRDRAKDYQWLFTNIKIPAIPRQHVMDGLFEFARIIGVAADNPSDNSSEKSTRQLRWDIPIPPQARDFVQQHIPEDKPYVVISPCSSARFRNWRNWSAEGYASICDYLAQEHGIMTVLTGGPSELELKYGENIVRMANSSPLNLIGKSNLKQLLAIIKSARFIISPDSGPAHMATTVNTPVIGLYVTSNPDRTGPYLSQQWVINKYPEALKEETGHDVNEVPWGTRVRSPDAMQRITTTDVIKKIEQLLSANNQT